MEDRDDSDEIEIDVDDTIADEPGSGPLAFDEVTPAGLVAAVRRFTADEISVCESFIRLAPVLEECPVADRPFFLRQFIALCRARERSARKLRDALTAQLEIETVFSPKR
jgi:hypothetical protein